MEERFREKLAQLFEDFYLDMLSYAKSSLRSQSLAEEAVQEAFRIACQKPEALFTSENPKGWLLNTLKYVIRNLQRRMARDSRLVAAAMAEKSIPKAADVESLDLTLLYGDLSRTEEFRLIKEFSVDGKSVLELAEDRGISLDACKKRMQRARQKLKEKITKKYVT